MTGRPVPYTRAEMARLMSPRSVAIVGASERKGSFGNRAMENLASFDGPVYLVNARYREIGGKACYPDVAALPEVPDCVYIAVGREAVEPIVTQCAELGVGGAIVVASGYVETARPERAAEQQRLTVIARRSGMRLVGPNTIGIVNYAIGAGLTFSAMPDRRPLLPHAIGIVSQSGSLGFSLAQAIERGTSVSHVLTSGNSCDVDVADYVAALAEEPACRAIACVFEGMADPRRMIRAAEIAWQAGKPLILYKMATGTAGAQAAMSHTGSLAGSNEAYEAAFARAGVVQVDRLEAVVEAAAFFAKAPAPSAPGVAMIATSGGATIMAADKAELHGVPLPQPGPFAAGVLAERVPEFGSPRNPCDVTAQVLTDPGALLACTDALLADPAFAALVTSHAYAYASATARLAVFSACAAKHGKIVCNLWAPEWLGGPGARETEEDPHLALFHSTDRCFAALAAWQRRGALARQAPRDPTVRVTSPSVAAQARALLQAAPARALTESEAKRVMALYGIPVVEDRLVQTAEEAASTAEALGFPVVLKVESPDILHKTEAGVVRLNLVTADAVRSACEEILTAAAKVDPTPRIKGVLVQPMIPKGVEMLIGGRTDPQFGPLIVVGLGGVFVEVLKDAALALAPVQQAEALAMLRGLRGAALLSGFRKSEPVDLDKLADIVCRASELIADASGLIAEMDINPLICADSRITAVDGLIVKAAE
jgi:acyl-CoA synthetase (NDP forming)